MNEMAERVVRAIYAKFEDRPLYAQAQMNDILANELAQAAIEAMHEPTTAMLKAASPFPEHLVAEHGEGSRKLFEAATLTDQMVARSTWIKMVEEAAK